MQPLCIHCTGRFLFHTCGIRTLFIYFTNHVGEQRNFCFAEIRRPAAFARQTPRYPHNVWQEIVRFFSFVTNSSLTASISGCRGRQPLHQSSTATKSLSLLRTLPCIRGHKKRCRVSTPTPLCLYLYFIFLYKVHIPYHGNISLPPPAKTNILSRFPRTSFHAFSSLQIFYLTIRW